MGVVCLLGLHIFAAIEVAEVVDVEGGGIGADEEGLRSEGVYDGGVVDSGAFVPAIGIRP